MSYSSSWKQFQTAMMEASPYLLQQLVKTTSRDLSEIERTLTESYSDDKSFQNLINLMFGKYKDKIIPNDKRIAQSTLDLDLWFLINYQLRKKKWKIRIPPKFTGRLFELVLESILKAYLRPKEFEYRFVDYDPVDYMILEDNMIICEISCKSALSENARYDYQRHANTVQAYRKGQRGKFVVFCGVTYPKEKTIIRETFEKIENCRLFYLWDRPGRTIQAYTLDSTFYNLIDYIKGL